MTTIDRSALHQNDFLFILDRAPNLQYFSQSASVPAMRYTGDLAIETPFHRVNQPGDKLDFEDLTIEFIVDEQLENYLEILNWFLEQRRPDLDTGNKNTYSDIILVLEDNNKNAKFRVRFIDAFPLSLSQLDFNTHQTDGLNVQKCSVVFKYNYFVFEKIETESEPI